MTELPADLRYAKTHEWSKLDEDTVIRIGITDFAQSELGDLVYIDLPEIGRQLTQGEQCATVESVKTASDLYSPVTGTVVEINEDLADEPELVNESPYDTWLFAIKADNLSELDQLLSAEDYRQHIGG
ncbi:glycine cleavage system protein GcvH [methane-oxidizing endosymbiont of Gigantopelta aegis]|uniref:glycine cleavage system protein GcvH n=1 Tax=methane-oxidizing endosymbiont of Gigantopelta aegis TaxID=2794938 RepID=UPI0018DC971E|nr:glycine cleavage system protein GcvH [methane-oxidizing endosymbiont of Gigantopelta aegis]